MNETTLSTVIKFVAGGSGTGTGDASVSTASSSVSGAASAAPATGDLAIIFAVILIAIVAGIAVFGYLANKQKVVCGAHVAKLSKSKTSKTLFFSLFASCILAFGITAGINAGNPRALADNTDALTSTPVVGTVDQQTGEVTFAESIIKNSTDKPQEITKFNLESAPEISTLENVTWTIKIGDTKVFEGKVGDSQTLTDSITIEAGATVKMTVSVKDMSADLAKSLIGKDVAIARSSYDVAGYTVSAKVDDSTHGSVEPTSINVKPGTTYTAEASNNKITFGTGTEEQTITFSPASGFKLDKWMIGTEEATTGIVANDMTFKANTKAIEKKSLTTTYNGKTVWFVPAFANNTAKTYLANVKFYNNSGAEITAITDKINDNSLTMNYLYENHLKSGISDDDKISQVSNSGTEKVTFYGVLDETWVDVFSYSGTEEEPATGYNTGSPFYQNFLDDEKGIGTVYFSGPKASPTLREDWNWSMKQDKESPTLNGVAYSDGDSGSAETAFFGAYGGFDGGVLSSRSSFPWSSRASDDSNAYYWRVRYGHWSLYSRGRVSGVVVFQAF